jgi:hypothetical protein
MGQTKSGVHVIGVGDEAEGSGRAIAQQDAERIQVEGRESPGNALDRGRVRSEVVQGVVFGEIGHD